MVRHSPKCPLPRQAPYVDPDPNAVTAICSGDRRWGSGSIKGELVVKGQVLNSTIAKELQIPRSHVIVTGPSRLSRFFIHHPLAHKHHSYTHCTPITPRCSAGFSFHDCHNPNIPDLRPVRCHLSWLSPLPYPLRQASSRTPSRILYHRTR